MSDAKQNPDATPDPKLNHQVGEDKGPIKGPQVTEDQMQRKDVPRGSAGERRRASKGAR